MPPLLVFRLMLYVAASLTLVLAGCRSAVIVPQFSAAAGYRAPLPAPRFDTVAASTALNGTTTQQRRVNAEARSRVGRTPAHAPREKQEPAGKPGRRHAKAAAVDSTRSLPRLVAPRQPRKPPPFKLFSAQTLVHYSLHFAFPLVLALVFFPLMWQTAYLIMVATMLIDLDHLLAKPIFEPRRCSIGYHPLHSFYALPVYALLLLLPATQIVAVGILFHLFTDTVDCLWSFRHCHECYLNSRIYALRNRVRKLLGRKATD